MKRHRSKITQNFLGVLVGPTLGFLVDPRSGIPRILIVRAGRGYTWNLRNPVFSKKIIRIAVFFRKLSYFRIVQRRQPAILNDRIVLTAFGFNRERREQEMNVQMTVENSIFSRPLLLFGAPERTEAHVDHTGAAALPLKTSGRMEFNVTRPEDLRIGADSDFPEIKQSWSRKTGILGALALFQ